MADTCSKCGREHETSDEAHDCVEYLLGVIETLKCEKESLEREVEEYKDSVEYHHRRAFEAHEEANRARAEKSQVEERAAMDRAGERRRRQKEEEDRHWAALTGRRW